MRGARRLFRSAVLALALLLVAPAASALVTVGPNGSGCRFTKLQDAITLVLNNERNGSADPFIGVIGGVTYNEALNLDGSNINSYDVFGTTFDHPFVQIYGDYDSCAPVLHEDGSSAATVSASGKSASALFIQGNKPVSVVLNHLTIADADLVNAGGGISFVGSGSLDLTNVDIVNNEANYGGGILGDGLDSGITITLHANTRIFDNIANIAGGGVRIESATHLVDLESPTLIWNNTANPGSTDGSGGGLQVTNQAVADIGGTYAGTGVIASNHARYGGGIAVESGGGLRLFSTVADEPALIADNTARTAGGGLYVNGGYVCASGYAIDNNQAGIPNGTVGEGSAIFLTNGADVHLTEAQLNASNGNAGTLCGHGFPLPQRPPCPLGFPCNQINDNGTSSGNDSILFVGSTSTLVADRFESRSNHANYLALANSGAVLKLGDCLIAGNVTLSSLISNSGVAQINGCTVAGNAFSAAGVPLFITGGASAALTLANSILASNTSAGSPAGSLISFGGTLQATDIIASEIVSLSPAAGSNVNSLDPAFVDPANGDYHLKPESPAVDYRLTNPPLFDPQKDLDGRVRDVNLLNRVGSVLSHDDIGAYELQSLGDLIFVDGVEGFR